MLETHKRAQKELQRTTESFERFKAIFKEKQMQFIQRQEQGIEMREKQLETNNSLVRANLDLSDTIRKLRLQCDRLVAEKEEAQRLLSEVITEKHVKESQISSLRVRFVPFHASSFFLSFFLCLCGMQREKDER